MHKSYLKIYRITRFIWIIQPRNYFTKRCPSFVASTLCFFRVSDYKEVSTSLVVVCNTTLSVTQKIFFEIFRRHSFIIFQDIRSWKTEGIIF